MNLGKKSPIVWVSGGDNGGKNPMKLKVKAIGPSGQVAEISLACGKAESQKLGNVYAQLKEHEKLKKGWVVYDLLGESEREELIKKRSAGHNEGQAEYQKLYETQLDRLTKAIEAGMVHGQRPQLTDEQLTAHMVVVPDKAKGKRA